MKIKGNFSEILRERLMAEFFKPTPLHYSIHRKGRREYLKAKREWYRSYKWARNRARKDSGYH